MKIGPSPLADPLHRVTAAAKAVGHPTRLRLLAMLGDSSLCVCQMTAVLGLAASTVSGHLSELRRAGLVREDRQGKWVEYSLTGDADTAGLLTSVLAALGASPQVTSDAATVRRLRTVSREVLSTVGVTIRTPSGLTRVGGRPQTPEYQGTRTRRPS